MYFSSNGVARNLEEEAPLDRPSIRKRKETKEKNFAMENRKSPATSGNHDHVPQPEPLVPKNYIYRTTEHLNLKLSYAGF